MVEYALHLDSIFGALSDHTRRDILKQVGDKELSVSEIARHYHLTLAAISKHLKVLEKAKLIFKRKQGKQQFVQLAPSALKDASEYLKNYENLWNDRFDSLEKYLLSNKK